MSILRNLPRTQVRPTKSIYRTSSLSCFELYFLQRLWMRSSNMDLESVMVPWIFCLFLDVVRFSPISVELSNFQKLGDCYHCWSPYCFFYQGFLSQTLTIHRTAGEGRGPFSIPLHHFYPPTNIQTFICNFACEMTITYF